MKKIAILLSCALISACANTPPTSSEPTLFPNSVASNNLDFIRRNDPSAYKCLAFRGTGTKEMPGNSVGDLVLNNVYIFEAVFSDGTSVEIWGSPAFGSQNAAKGTALPLAQALGKIPTFMRKHVHHVVMTIGDGAASAEEKAEDRFFMVQNQNVRTRISNNDLEETSFHETAHLSLDVDFGRSSAWRRAQAADGAYITDYAARLHDREDMAESALFAWAIIMHPGRLPAEVEAKVREIMPNRLAFFEDIFKAQPRFQTLGPANSC